MNWKLILTVLLVALLIVGAVTLPGALLEGQERALYAEKTAVDVPYSQFEGENSTLFQRLSAAQSSDTYTELDFDVGARLYWDRQTMLERFLEELTALGRELPSMAGQEYWVELLTMLLREGDPGEVLEVSYLCVVDASTGGTYVFACLACYLDGTLILCMDPVSEKLIGVKLYADHQWLREVDLYALAEEYAAYLGLTDNGLLWEEGGEAGDVPPIQSMIQSMYFLLSDPSLQGGIDLLVQQQGSNGLLLTALGRDF